METEREVKVVRVNITCPDCEIDLHLEKVPNFYSLGYEYICPRCKTTYKSETQYPYNKYIPK